MTYRLCLIAIFVTGLACSSGLGVQATLVLHGSATDDGLPNPPGMLFFSWTQISGPARVDFADPGAVVTGAILQRSRRIRAATAGFRRGA